MSKAEKDEAKRVEKEKRRELKKRNAAWSSKVVVKEVRDKRREKKERKRQWEKEVADKEAKEKADIEDWEEMAADEREARKAKRAKLISAGSSRAFIGL